VNSAASIFNNNIAAAADSVKTAISLQPVLHSLLFMATHKNGHYMLSTVLYFIYSFLLTNLRSSLADHHQTLFSGDTDLQTCTTDIWQ